MPGRAHFAPSVSGLAGPHLERSMSTFIAIEYDNPHKAQEVRLTLVKLQRELRS